MVYDSRAQIEYAKSGRAGCTYCGGNIGDGTVRVGIKSRSGFHDGFDISWAHLKCASRGVSSLADTYGYEHLRWEDQLRVRKQFGEAGGKPDPDDKRREAETDRLWEVIDELEYTDAQLKQVLDENKIPYGDKTKGVDLKWILAKQIVFGMPEACTTCKQNGLSYDINSRTYRCRGHISGFTRCDNHCSIDGIERYELSLPQTTAKCKFLMNYKPEGIDFSRKPRSGAVTAADVAATHAASYEQVKTNPKAGIALDGLSVGQVGNVPKKIASSKAAFNKLITKNGGVPSELDEDNNIIFTTPAEAKKTGKKLHEMLSTALEHGIPIVSYEYLTDLVDAETDEEVATLRSAEGIKEYILLGEAKDTITVRKRKADQVAADADAEEEQPAKKAKGKGGKAVKTTKGKATASAADSTAPAPPPRQRTPKPDSEIMRIIPRVTGSGSIYIDPATGDVYNAMLNQVDVLTGANKYYQLQLIQRSVNCVLVLDYGRVGGTGYGNDTKTYPVSAKEGMKQFAAKFLEKTKNKWSERHLFEKRPGLYNFVPLDDGWGETEAIPEGLLLAPRNLADPNPVRKPKAIESSLSVGVKRFVDLIFDSTMMKKTMANMDIDLTKMPLGKLSRRVLLDGLKTLTDIDNLIQKPSYSNGMLVDYCNRFYSFIPHATKAGVKLPLIDNADILKSKIAMIETLLDLQLANEVMMKNENDTSGSHPSDLNYKSLKIDLTDIDREHPTFKLIETYIRNTHAATHDQYTLEIEHLYEVSRQGESERFMAHKDMPNHQLLWHGSRLSNWVGILSTGLRIAPPEAPVTGYMFGKGIYFADMVSKSANYCFTSPSENTGILTLAQVALGKPYEIKQSDSNLPGTLPKGYDSTKGCGRTAPKADGAQDLSLDGMTITVPCGKSGDAPIGQSSLLYNEFIVYKESQARLKYIIMTKFNYKVSKYR